MRDDIYDAYNESINDKYEREIQMFRGNQNISKNNKFMYDDSEAFILSEERKEDKDDNDSGNIKNKKSNNEIEESFVFKLYNKDRVRKFSEKQMEEIRNSCKDVIVHDYHMNDWYHMSDDDRERNDMLFELNQKLGSIRRVYSKVDDYIRAMRIVYSAWNILAEKEYLYNRKEFFKLVSNGNIMCNRIIQPKLKHINQYNIDTIIAYISDDRLDPSDLVIDDDDNLLDELDDLPDNWLLSEDEIEMINSEIKTKMKLEVIDSKIISGLVGSWINRRNKVKLNKHDKNIRKMYRGLLQKISESGMFNNRNYSYTSYVTEDIFDIQDKDDNINVYRGSWANDEMLRLHELSVEQKQMEEITNQYASITRGDDAYNAFFKILERHDIDTLTLRRNMQIGHNKDTKRDTKKIRRINKQHERRTLDRIIKLSNSPKFKKLIDKAEKHLLDNGQSYEEY